jgi:hypothetical protein
MYRSIAAPSALVDPTRSNAIDVPAGLPVHGLTAHCDTPGYGVARYSPASVACACVRAAW